jgi:predicted transcriptional regulator
MKVILSIKPEFAEKIFEGTKKYEFRRAIFKNQQIEKVIVYASSPVKRIIGEFEIDQIISLDLLSLWNKTSAYSGITKDYFDEYFVNKEHGFAIKIKNIKRYLNTKCIRADYNLIPPQSFLYLRD